jgi:hypothetical protein
MGLNIGLAVLLDNRQDWKEIQEKAGEVNKM